MNMMHKMHKNSVQHVQCCVQPESYRRYVEVIVSDDADRHPCYRNSQYATECRTVKPFVPPVQNTCQLIHSSNQIHL